jgi:NADPH:quinone reductase-like Zn-dependent oxidoreductase
MFKLDTAKQREGQAILITGASSGIGEAIALYLDSLGFRVFAGVRTETAGKALLQKASPSLTPVLLDVTDTLSLARAAETVLEKVGDTGLAGLVNNAGVAVAGPLEFLPLEKFRYQLEVNLVGQLATTQTFLPLLRRGQGRVVMIGSIMGKGAGALCRYTAIAVKIIRLIKVENKKEGESMTQTLDKKLEIEPYILIHRAIERSLYRLEANARQYTSPAIDRVEKISAWWETLWLLIEHHHINEDTIAFPEYMKRDPSLVVEFDSLTADHHVLDNLVEQIRNFLALAQQPGDRRLAAYRQFVDTLSTFNAKMMPHLEREEGIVLSAEARLMTEAELDELGQRIMKAMPKDVLALEIPWMVDGIAEDTRKALFKSAPLIMKVLYYLSWKGKYEKRMKSFIS